MSVATKNPFAILDAEDASRSSSPAPAPANTGPQAPSVPTREAQKSRGPASRGGKYYSRGGAQRSAPRDSNQPQAEDPVTDNQRKFEGRGRGRGRGGPGRGGRRPFDRHSQTGKTDSDKKLHQGWGGDEGNTELKAEEAAANDAAAEATPESPLADGADAPPEDKPEGGRPHREREPEEEDTTLTLDQYLAQKKEKDSNLPKIEGTRQVNEDADSAWGGVVLSKSEEDESYFVGKTKNTPKTRAKKEDKVYIEIDGRFDRPDRPSRGRGRGGDRARGSRPRGGLRGGRQNGAATGPALDVDDQTAFPSLA